MIIGMTGKYCSGKSTCSQKLQSVLQHAIQNNVAHRTRSEPNRPHVSDTDQKIHNSTLEMFSSCKILDVDTIGHMSLDKNAEKLCSVFGNKILDTTGRIDRTVLGKIVFLNQDALRSLENIVHPWMYQNIVSTILNNVRLLWIIDCAVLYHIELHHLCTHILITHAPKYVRFLRAKKRDNLSTGQIIRRMRTQKNIPDKTNYHNIIALYKSKNIFNKQFPSLTNKKSLNKQTAYSDVRIIKTHNNAVLNKQLQKFIEGVWKWHF